jgi:modification methylase
VNLLPAFTGVPEVNKVYQVGALTLLRALPDNSVDCVVTSPPYNVAVNMNGGGLMKNSAWMKNFSKGYTTHADNMNESDYQQWIQSAVRECLRVCKGIVWVNHKTRYRDGVGIHPLSFLPFPMWSEIVWNRGGSITLNARKFAPSHEFVYGFGTPHYWNNNSNTLMSVWRIATVNKDDGHPCPFPETLVERLINASCPYGGVVLDPFLGSGTTARVAFNLGRRYIGSDISAEYCDIARRRLALPYTPNMFIELEKQESA